MQITQMEGVTELPHHTLLLMKPHTFGRPPPSILFLPAFAVPPPACPEREREKSAERRS